MRISKRDWAQLSAYLDGELNQRESEKMQKRIEGNPGFQAALEDLRTVKTVLSHTPRLSVPRNFALRQNLIKSPRRSSPVRGYSLAAAALSFLFIGVVVIDIGSGMMKGGLSAAQAPKAEEIMLEAVADEMEESAPLAKEGAVEEELAPAAEMAEAPEPSESFDAGMDDETAKMQEGESNNTQEEADRATGEGEDILGEDSPDIQNTPAPIEVVEYEEAPSIPDQDYWARRLLAGFPWMLILEIILGLGAVGFAGAAWWKRRNNRKS